MKMNKMCGLFANRQLGIINLTKCIQLQYSILNLLSTKGIFTHTHKAAFHFSGVQNIKICNGIFT